MIHTLLTYSTELTQGVQQRRIRPALLSHDSQAHQLCIRCTQDGQPANLEGATVVGYFLRQDGNTVAFTGTASGDQASCVLPAGCYTQTGAFSLVVKLSQNGTVSTIFWGVGDVAASRTDQLADNERLLPSLAELLAQIDAMEAATAAASAATAQATTAATSADTATAAVVEATDEATAAAADAKAATTAANTATANATTATASADTATAAANTAADRANAEAASASAAADAAHTAATGADASAASADAAAAAATTAAAAAQAVADMTATATTLSPGSQATASYADGVLAFGIPQGEKGDKGDTGEPGTSTSVNGIAPVDSNVTITAADIPLSGEDATTVQDAISSKLSPTDLNIRNGSVTSSLRTVGSSAESSDYTMGEYAFAQGQNTKAAGMMSHAEGYATAAGGFYCHAEGDNTSTGSNSGACHAEGSHTVAENAYCHAEGFETLASGTACHAEGIGTTAKGYAQLTCGKYNVVDEDKLYYFIIGCGTDDSSRRNALTVDTNGNLWVRGEVLIQGTDQKNAAYGVATSLYNINNKLTDITSTISTLQLRIGSLETRVSTLGG